MLCQYLNTKSQFLCEHKSPCSTPLHFHAENNRKHSKQFKVILFLIITLSKFVNRKYNYCIVTYRSNIKPGVVVRCPVATNVAFVGLLIIFIAKIFHYLTLKKSITLLLTYARTTVIRF